MKHIILSKNLKPSQEFMTIGWREWISLPDLGLPAIKAKIDTGAKTSALHAFFIERFKQDGSDFIRFCMHPLQKNRDLVIRCEAPLHDERIVRDSGGHKELRYVIETKMILGTHKYPIEMTLTNRDSMNFRMLLGRSAMKNRLLVNPSQSYLCGKLNYQMLYTKDSL